MKKIWLIMMMVFSLVFLCHAPVGRCAYHNNWGEPIGNAGSGGWVTTSPYGPREAPVGEDGRSGSALHLGADLAISDDIHTGNELAVDDGYIYEIGYQGGGYGNYIILHVDHHPNFENGVYVLYAHWYALVDGVYQGKPVRKGDPLTFMESETGEWSGTGTGPHLHIEIQPDFGQEPFSSQENREQYSWDPALFHEGIALGSGDAPVKPANGIVLPEDHKSSFPSVKFEFKYQMIEGFRTVFETLAHTIVEAMSRIHKIIYNLFLILIMIDLAIGTMYKVFAEDDSGGDMVRYFVFKFLFYGIFLYMINNYADLANHLVRDWFVGAAGISMGLEEAEVIRLISDPMLIIETGLNIIQPILNSAFTYSWNIPLGGELAAAIVESIIPGSQFIMMIFILIFSIIFIVLLSFIALLVALAYIQFYFFILFSFTTLIFAGTKQTRQTRLANKGLTGVFAGALNLMFYAIFTLMLSQCLVAIASQASVPDMTTVRPSSGSGSINQDYEANARAVYDDFRAAGYSDEAIAGIMGRLQQEHGFDTSDVEEHWAYDEETGEALWVGGYGMYQWNGSRTESFLNWCAENGYDPQDAHTQNAYAIKEAHERGLTPERMNSLSATEAAAVWTEEWEVGVPGNEYEYANEMREQIAEWSVDGKSNPANPKAGSSQSRAGNAHQVPMKTKSLSVLIQLNLCLAIFVLLAIRIEGRIKQLCSGNGFELLSSQHE